MNSNNVIKICRTCLQELNGSQFFYLNAPHPTTESITIQQKLLQCVPTLNLGVTPNSLICRCCLDVIELAYKFNNRCIEIEKTIQTHIENTDHNTLCVDLVKIHQHQKHLLDSNNVGQSTEQQEPTPEFFDVFTTNFVVIRKNENKNVNHYNTAKNTRKLDNCIKTYRCRDCSYTTTKKMSLMVHKKLHQSYSCNDCKMQFAYEKSFDNHMKGHRIDNPYKCPQCDHTTTNQSTLNIHMHNTNHFHKCNICSYRTQYYLTFKGHMLDVHGELITYKCKTCLYTTSAYQDLKAHEKIHTQEKSFKCKICKYSFPNQFRLDKHITIHAFKCISCGFETSSQERLDRHEQLRHKINKTALGGAKREDKKMNFVKNLQAM